MVYWIYTPEQGERIRAGDKTARDQFFSDNLSTLKGAIKKYMTTHSTSYELHDFLNTVYISLPKWSFDHPSHITMCLHNTLYQATFTRGEILEYRKTGCYPYYSPLTYTDGEGEEQSIIDLYYSEEPAVFSDECLTDAHLLAFFKPLLRQQEFEVLCYMLQGLSFHDVKKILHLKSQNSRKVIRKVFAEHYHELCEYVKPISETAYHTFLSASSLHSELVENIEATRIKRCEEGRIYNLKKKAQKTAL